MVFESAGFINAFSYMQPESRDYLNKMSIKHSDFVPQLINSKLLEDNDLIITMEQSHKQNIINNYSKIKNINRKTFTLKEFNGAKEDLNIVDPYYHNQSTYRKIMQIIDNQIERLIQKIMKIKKNTS